MLRWAVAALLALAPVVVVMLLWRRVRRVSPFSPSFLALLVAVGALAGALAVFVEQLLLGWADLQLGPEAPVSEGLVAMFLLAAPLEEGLKAAVLWPFYSSGRVTSARRGMTYAVSIAAGFASAENAVLAQSGPSDALQIIRVLMGFPVQLFAAGLWGYYLGRGVRPRGRWFSVAWLCATLVHALHAHLVFGRGPAFLLAAATLVFGMAGFTWLVLREVAPLSSSREAPLSTGDLILTPRSGDRATILSSLPEPPSLRAMRRALRRTDRPVMFHWILIGALVTVGVMLVLLAGSVFLGHELGVDFARVEDPDQATMAPLVLLGGGILLSFPSAGFLVAKASSATSVLEPALGAGVAIVAVILLLSLAAPLGVLFAIALAPIAFGLACGGAWFGMAR